MDTSVLIFFVFTLAGVVLYFALWNRWGLRGVSRVAKWTAIAPLAITFLFAGLMTKSEYEGYVDGLPVKQVALNGISLGDTVSDVRFKFGKPNSDETRAKSISYEYHDKSIQIGFNKESEKVKIILFL
jgi:hypothetical protein